MDCNAVLRAHVLKHPAQPVVGDGGDQVGHDAQLGATECRGHRITSERDRIRRRDMFFIPGRHMIGDKSYVDISLSDEECLHKNVRRKTDVAIVVTAIGRSVWGYISIGPISISVELFASLPPVSLEIRMGRDYD